MIAGTLTVEMNANIARLSKDMNDAKRKVSDTMDSINTAVSRTTGLLASIGVGVGFAAIVAGFNRVVDAAARLDDVSERTGAAVEELSKLEQVARIGGHSMESAEMALIRLAKALHGTGEESKGAGKALAALGLQADALRGKDTAEALRIVAVELNKYQDGAGKTALALDLLGKSGAQALPLLKDLATEQGIATRVTTEQAAAAEELQKSLGRLRNEMQNTGQAVALRLVPPLVEWIEANREAVRVAGGVGNALRLFVFNLQALTTEGPREQISRLTAEIERLEREASKPFWQRGGLDVLFGKQSAVDTKKQIEFLKFLERQQALAGAAALGGDTAGERQRFGLAGVKQVLDYGSAASTTTDKLKSLREEVARLHGEANKAASVLDAAIVPMLMRGETLEQAKQRLTDTKKLLDDGRKGWIAYAESVFSAADAENTAAASGESFTQWAEKTKNRVLDLIDPLRQLKKEHADLDLLVATGWMTEMDARLAKLPQSVRDLLQPIKNIHDEIQKAWESGLLTTEQMQDAVLRASDKIDKATDSAKDFGHAISTAFEDAVIEGRKLKDVVNALGVTIAKIFFRQQVTKPLENAIGGLNFGDLLKGALGLGGFVAGSPQQGPIWSETGSPGAITIASSTAHTGGIAGMLPANRAVNAEHFYGAPRFHRGGIAGGEVPIVAKVGEGIFTPEQMSRMQPTGGGVSVVINQDNRGVDSSVIARMEQANARLRRDIVPMVADAARRGGSARKAIRG